MFAKEKVMFWDELLTLLLPTMMILLSGNPVLCAKSLASVITTWTIVIIIGSFTYSLMAVNAGHHGYEIVHEGDEFQSLDYGIYQLGATIDRIEANLNLPMTLTTFGNHTLHHLFPSLDHALLPQLREILLQTCEEFEWEIKKYSMLHAAIEQFKQLGRCKIVTLKMRKEFTEKNMKKL